MASIEQLISQPARPLANGNSAAGGALNISTGALGSRTKGYITAILISASAAPASPVAATLTIAGQTLTFQIPASAYAPMLLNFSKAPLESDFGETIALAVPAHGGAVVISGAILGYKVSA